MFSYVFQLGTNKSKKRSSKGGGSSHGNATATASDQAKALQRRQRIAQQLETLTEFAELHLGSLVERSYMLTEACLALKKYGTCLLFCVIIPLFSQKLGRVNALIIRITLKSLLLCFLLMCSLPHRHVIQLVHHHCFAAT